MNQNDQARAKQTYTYRIRDSLAPGASTFVGAHSYACARAIYVERCEAKSIRYGELRIVRVS